MVVPMSAGPKMSEIEGLRVPTGGGGNADIAACPIRRRVRLILFSEFAGCLCASQCTDSGTHNNTRGMNAAVAAAPK